MPATAQEVWQSLREDFRPHSSTAELDARLLLENVTGKALYQCERDVLPAPQRAQLHGLAQRRCAGEPVARLLGQREFYGRDFTISPAVLDPRPETEFLVECAVAQLQQVSAPRFLDLGTGSGCVAITIGKECGIAQGRAIDRNSASLAVAWQNARALACDNVRFSYSNWFSHISGRFDVIVSNPPYISATEWKSLPVAVRDYDPLCALQAGADGLAAYRAILRHAHAYLAPKGRLLLEHGSNQAQELQALAQKNGWHICAQHKDLAGHWRVLCLESLKFFRQSPKNMP